MTRTRLAIVAGVVGFLVVASSWVSLPVMDAQGTAAQQTPMRVRVQVTQVKPDMIQQWQSHMREALPALKKAGMAWRHVWQDGGPFGAGSTFITVQPVTNFAQFDQPNAVRRGMGDDAYAKYQAKLTPTIVSSRAWIDVYQREASIESGAKAMPPLALVQSWQVLPGKTAEFVELWRTEYRPRYQKAGVRDAWLHTSTYGGHVGQVTIVRSLSKYAELDQTPGLMQRGGLSAEAAQKLNARRAALVSGFEQTVIRHLPELSYGMPSGATN